MFVKYHIYQTIPKLCELIYHSKRNMRLSLLRFKYLCCCFMLGFQVTVSQWWPWNCNDYWCLADSLVILIRFAMLMRIIQAIFHIKRFMVLSTSQTTSEWHMDELAEHNLGLPFCMFIVIMPVIIHLDLNNTKSMVTMCQKYT